MQPEPEPHQEPEPKYEHDPDPVDEHHTEHPNPRGPPPPIPPKWTRPSPAELARALARRPPPPPIPMPEPEPESESTYAEPSPPISPREAGPPQRRLPPMPLSLPTPPPEAQPEPYKEEVEEEAYYEPVPYDESTSCLQCRDFSHVDAHAARFPRHTVTSLDNLAYDLTEPFPYETEKARAIFTWMHHNIAYDAESFLSGNLRAASAESTLASGLAVCDGYAGLFKSLAERVGMQTHRVVGHGKGVGYVAMEPGAPVPAYSSGHAWNCVYMDGQWRLVDACWGAGTLNGRAYEPRFNPTWFTSGPAEFGRRHFPEDASYQLMSEEEGGAIQWEEYIMEPEGPTVFVDFYDLDLWQSALQPATKNIEGGQRIVFSVFKRCEHMSTAEANNFVYFISLADNTRVPLERNAEGGWSAEVYIPRGSGEVSLYSVTTVDGRDAMGLGIQTFKQALGRKRMSFGGLARWTVV